MSSGGPATVGSRLSLSAQAAPPHETPALLLPSPARDSHPISISSLLPRPSPRTENAEQATMATARASTPCHGLAARCLDVINISVPPSPSVLSPSVLLHISAQIWPSVGPVRLQPYPPAAAAGSIFPRCPRLHVASRRTPAAMELTARHRPHRADPGRPLSRFHVPQHHNRHGRVLGPGQCRKQADCREVSCTLSP